VRTSDRGYRKAVEHYYSKMALNEWRRLTRDAYHQLEFKTTMHYLKMYLPPDGYVLDAGGGPGRYTIELAKMGYDVALVDFTAELLTRARIQINKAGVNKQVRLVAQGTICDLSRFDDATFDAVVCLGGPLGHVLNRAERKKSINELTRVATKEAPIFVSVIGRPALLATELTRLPHEIELPFFPTMRDTGDYRGGYGFAPCHFYNPKELRQDFEKTGASVLQMVGLEGLASGHQKETNRLFKKYPAAWKIWWETHLKTCTDPVSVGISEHFMIICRKWR
jgi:ubiquinone/menaquinone biosynthesis C-methylase UbiE